MTLDDLPTFTIDHVATGGESVSARGRFHGPIQVKSGWLAHLHLGEGQFLRGRFSEVDDQAAAGTFLATRLDGAALAVGGSYGYLDGYWGRLAALVCDPSRAWARTEFHPRDSVRGGDVIPGGWDHEHCEICSDTIAEDAQPFGYADENDDWVCEACYRKFVVPKRLDFITAGDS